MTADGRHQAASRLAVAIAATVILAGVLSLVLWVGSGLRPLPVAFGRTPIGVLGLVFSPICYAAVGAILAAYQPRNAIGWIFLAASVSIGVILPVNLIVTAAHEPLRQPSDLVVWVAWARTAFGSPTMLPLLVAAALLFPDGRPLTRRWRAALLLAAITGSLLVLATAFDPRGLWSYPSLPNPTALPYAFESIVGGVRVLGTALLVACIVLAVASLALRYRRGDFLLRAQLRWIVVAAAIGAAAALPYVAARYLFDVDDSTGEVASAIAQLGSCALPLAAAFSMSRYQLFEVDILIGRTLVYLPLMGILSGLYTAGVALFQRLLVALTGETSDLATLLAILLVASAFTPVRRALEAAADRRFPARLAPHAHPTAGSPEPSAVPISNDPSSDTRIVPSAQLITVEASGEVSCPVGGQRNVLDCLSCGHLRATVAGSPAAIVCDVPSSP